MIHENKQSRHYAIKQILDKENIPNQDKLRIQLKKQGFKITQATLSRDLKELGISRFTSPEGAKYQSQLFSAIQILKPQIVEEIVSINSNECEIVISTLPGCASVVAEFIDSQKNKDIIGTIAGDNTLMVIPSSVKKINIIKNYLIEKLIRRKI